MKFIIDNIWLVGLAILSGGGLLWQSLQQRAHQLSIFQATQLINQGKAAIVDVRDSYDYAAGHMPAAKNIPAKELSQRIGELEKSKSKAIIVVCSSGKQSVKAAAELKKAGFNEVYSLEGGVTAWQAQGLPITK
ncbi:MAG: rhodanese-like domain-containing protein [Burkholderiaceae bacterium]